jgi:23S rRNA pseudouridine1911/1915/1917 synthase
MTPEITEVIVSEEHSGLRLDKFLSLHEKIRTRSRAEFLISSSLVLVNLKQVKASYQVKTNDRVEIHFPVEKTRTLEAVDIPLDIVYEDKEVIVINKPAGMVVHPSAGHESGTLVNALLFHTKDLSMKFNEERPGIVHRIDKETSGLLVVAKNDFSHEKLVQQFQERKVHRIYKAVVFGDIAAPTGRIESHLGRHPTDRKRFASVAEGKWSATRFKVLKRAHQLSYLELKLETGRTHQIRVHLSEKGHPLVGDNLYGGQKKIKSIEAKRIQEDIKNLSRFLLHAEQLGFFHPTTGEWMQFERTWPEKDLTLLKSWDLL